MFAPRRSSRLATKSDSSKEPLSKKPRLSRPKKPSRRPPPTPAVGPVPELLYLRISRRFLNQLPAAVAGQPDPAPLPPPPGAIGHLYVITTNLQDLHPFAGNTVDWLIRVARLIFEPLGMSSLFTFTADTVVSWLNRDMHLPQWRQVEQGEPLRATIYEFRPNDNAPITLSKISLRQARSVTTNISRDQATAFRNAILARDERCIISQSTFTHVHTASHLVPRRLGDVGATSVVHRFTGLDAVVTRFDPTLGVLLFQALDALVDSYELGFWHLGPDQYVVHCFFPQPVHIYGGPLLTPNDPVVHNHTITFPTNNAAFPPIGVFNWHYLQCVLKRFSTPEYHQIQNIYYSALPFRTREDEEDDESDRDFDDERNIANSPYPSYLNELAEAKMRQRLEDAERNQAIVEWNSEVSTSGGL